MQASTADDTLGGTSGAQEVAKTYDDAALDAISRRRRPLRPRRARHVENGVVRALRASGASGESSIAKMGSAQTTFTEYFRAYTPADDPLLGADDRLGARDVYSVESQKRMWGVESSAFRSTTCSA
jgi:hypothetical protein